MWSWFSRRKSRQPSRIESGGQGETANTTPSATPAGDEASIELRGRTVTRRVIPVIGATILELAERNRVDWSSNCRRGICARCRCRVEEGMEYLTKPNSKEIDRLEPEELEQGYRLGCQAKLESAGKVVVKHAPYFY